MSVAARVGRAGRMLRFSTFEMVFLAANLEIGMNLESFLGTGGVQTLNGEPWW